MICPKFLHKLNFVAIRIFIYNVNNDVNFQKEKMTSNCMKLYNAYHNCNLIVAQGIALWLGNLRVVLPLAMLSSGRYWLIPDPFGCNPLLTFNDRTAPMQCCLQAEHMKMVMIQKSKQKFVESKYRCWFNHTCELNQHFH